MSAADSLGPELRDLAEAVGLLDANGDLDANWFAQPLQHVESILSDPGQLAATIKLLDDLFPPQQVAGLGAGDEWRPLLDTQPRGNVYLTTNTTGSNVLLGVAANFDSEASAPGVSLRARLPLVQSAGGNLSFVAAQAQTPFSIELRVELDWSLSGGQSIGLKAVRANVAITLSPTPAAAASITLEQLQLSGEAPADLVLDPSNLGPESARLAVELIEQLLASQTGAAGEIGAIANHLLPLLGFGGGAGPVLPPFPLVEFVHDPTAIQRWFAALTQDAAVLQRWMQELAGLLGQAVGPVQGDGSVAAPWAVPLLALGGGGSSSLDFTAALATNNGQTFLQLGALVHVAPGAAPAPFQLEAQAVIASIPLAGPGSTTLLQSASALVVAPAILPTPGPWISKGGFSINQVRAGLTLSAGSLQPLLELIQVTLPTSAAVIPVIDLTNSKSIASAATDTLKNALLQALGNGPGLHLARLVGLLPPADDAASPYSVDLLALASNPAGALATFHRQVLADAAGHGWNHLLDELASLFGLGGVTGNGTAAKPWVVTLGDLGPLTLSLAAWNAQTVAGGDPQQLRLGLAAEISQNPLAFTWAAELLAVDLPNSGQGKLSLMAGQHATFSVQPLPSAPPVAGMSLLADSFTAGMDWQPGGSMQWTSAIQNVRLQTGAATVNLGTVSFPIAGGLDFSNPAAVAGALGITIPDLELALCTLIARAAYSWAGIPGITLAHLFGLSRSLAGLQSDWPTLADPGAAGTLFSDPFSAFRLWLNKIATQVSANQTPFVFPLLAWTQSLLSGGLPSDLSTVPPLIGAPIEGSGTYDDPWMLPLFSDTPSSADVLVWLDAAGGLTTPPAAWVAGIAAQIAGAADFDSLLKIIRLLAPFVPGLRGVLAGRDLEQVSASLGILSGYLALSDGVVPAASQTVSAPHWTTGNPLSSPHHLLPQDASAINQIVQQVHNWGNKAVLLIGPSFGDHTDWAALITNAAVATANFNLRVPGIDPKTVDLSSVTTAVPYYTAELQDDGIGDLALLIGQIGHLVARIQQLNGPQPVILVGHSTAGVAAREFTAANPALVQGLITLGTPHQGAPLTFLTDPGTADAVRFLQALMPAAPGADAMQSLLAHLKQAIDGYKPPAAAGQLPIAAPYPVGSFNFAGATHLDTGGPPALALVSTLNGALAATVQSRLTTLAATAAAPNPVPLAPTHLGLGLRTRLNLSAPLAGEVAVDGYLRVDAFLAPLLAGAPAPPHPAQALHVRTRLSRSNDWLLGEASPFGGLGLPQIDVRVRWAELGADIVSNATGLQVQPVLQLYDAAFHSPISALVALGDAQAQLLLGAVLQGLSSPAPRVGSPADLLLSAFGSLGIAVSLPPPQVGLGISADAFAAIATDPVGFLAPRVKSAISAPGGLAGIGGPSGGPFALNAGSLQLYVTPSPWTVGVRTPAAGPLQLAANTSLSFNGSLQLPGFTPGIDATLTVGTLALTWSQSSKTLMLQSACLDPIQIYPKLDAAGLAHALNSVLPGILFSAPASAALENLLPPGLSVAPLNCLFHHTGQSVAGSSGLGNGSGGLDGSKIALILQAINTALGGVPGPGISLPANVQFTASGTGTSVDPTILQLATTADIGGVLGLQLGVSFDNNLHVTPLGSATLTISALGGNPWTAVKIAFGLSGSDVTLSVTPTPGDTIQILPKFSGFGSLLGLAEALLPEALDALVAAVEPSAVADAVLKIATDLNLYNAGGFKTHVSQLQALLQGQWTTALALSNTQLQGAANDFVAFLTAQGFASASDQVSVTDKLATWTHTLGTAGQGQGSIAASLGWDTTGPAALLTLAGFQPGGGALKVDLNGGFQSGAPALSLAASVSLQDSLSIPLSPKLSVGFGGGSFQVQCFPLAANGVNGPLTVNIAPTTGVSFSGGTAADVIEELLVPLVANVVWSQTQGRANNALWTAGAQAGPKLGDVLTSAGILTAGKITSPLPSFLKMASGLIVGLVDSQLSIPVTSTLTLSLVKDATGRGVRLSGSVADIPVGDLNLAVLFGPPSTWSIDDAGVTVYFLTADATSPAFQLSLDIGGLGLGLSGQGDAPLINTDAFRLGAVRAYFFVRVLDLVQGQLDSVGGGLELDAIGLPLGQASDAGGNPVAANLMSSSGGGGDPHPVNPGVDVGAWYRNGPLGDASFHITFNGIENQPLWIGIHAGFGPIYIDQIGLEPTQDGNGPGMALLIDGSVKVDGFTAQADELGVTIPFKYLRTPGQWTLDLKGLGVGFQTPGVTVAGGLYKSSGQPVEYDGMLLIDVAEFGLIAVGAYSIAGDPPNNYTSLFIFVAAFIPIPIPPVVLIEGLGLGVGYNREILVPDDLNLLPSFPLVAALDNPGTFANDPMGELKQFATDMPARRGSFWLAAGAQGTSFELVHITVVVYVALDRGVEIGILGVARMALPPDVDFAIVSVELALKARFSSAEGILSIQAQLTDNSYLLSPDNQLTGGFAYFMWFPQSQFVLTLGGYHPSFNKPVQFPDVPRLGFHWWVPPAITIKGEAYFALTNTCVMFGGRLEVTYGIPIVNVWFHAYADVLVSWDPFYYTADIGISVGATFSLQVCAWGVCVGASFTVSVGATLALSGPPLHGEVTVDLAVGSVTVPFGPDPPPQPSYLGWDDFRAKYLLGGDATASAVNAHVLAGLTPPEPSGAQPSPGTQGQPWIFQSEFTVKTSTTMPARGYIDFIDPNTTHAVDGTYQIDLAPMNVEDVTSTHKLVLEGQDAHNNWVVCGPNAAEPFQIDYSHFSFSAAVGQVSDATWHYYDPSQVPAAAYTLPEILGLQFAGTVFIPVPGPAIPIATLVDDGNPRPLPFATPGDIPTLKQFGTAADQLASLATGVDSKVVFSAVAQMVSGPGFFSQARIASGLPASGLPAIAVRSFTRSRSAPPLLTPLTTGLTMKPVGQPAPPQILHLQPVVPVGLNTPRLRAVLHAAPTVVADAPIALHTSAAVVAARVNSPASTIPRMRAPVTAPIAGAQLIRVRAPSAPRPTQAPHFGSTLRNAEIGWSPSVAQLGALKQAATDLLGDGVIVTSGATHIWDLPASKGAQVKISGDPVRLVFMTRGGKSILDREYVPGQQIQIPVPSGAAMLAVIGLGRWLANLAAPAPGFGSVSAAVGPSGAVPATGWQAASEVVQTSATTLLARGAMVLLAQSHLSTQRQLRTAQAMVRAAAALPGQVAVETWLPAQTGCVMVLLDEQDPTAVAYGDFSIAAAGATLAVPPLRVVGGNRRALLYDISQRSPNTLYISVTAGSTSAWRLSGVVGLQGDAQSWAARLNGAVPSHIVPNGPMTPDGQTRVQFVAGNG